MKTTRTYFLKKNSCYKFAYTHVCTLKQLKLWCSDDTCVAMCTTFVANTNI